ncbi:MAG: biotin--[acetyl-CoA-carboxylase] ligase [Gaiellales bacterium]|nr:biotin--[acetyl-CoA-carboxylase] ligase [Gaiellales bacterium]
MNKIPKWLDAGHLQTIDERIGSAVQCGLFASGSARRLRLAARLLNGEMVSGEALAADLGLSRAAVHKQVETLRSSGWAIESRPGTGYQVNRIPDSLEPGAALPWVLAQEEPVAPGAGGFLGLPYHFRRKAFSSNDLLRAEAEKGAPEGALVVVEEQSAGRGRLGRHWVSRPGDGLTFSLLLRPRMQLSQLGLLPLAAALGIAWALARDCGLGRRVAIKWPNDVLVDGGKVCGILAEASVDMDAVHWLVAGIGVNVNGHPAAYMPKDGVIPAREAAVSLEEVLGQHVPRGPLLGMMLATLRAAFQLAADDGRALIREYGSFDFLRGALVQVQRGVGGEPPLRGMVEGVAHDGSLLVRDATSSVIPVSAGDVYRVRPTL